MRPRHFYFIFSKRFWKKNSLCVNELMVWIYVHLVYKIPVIRRFREIGERRIIDSPYPSLRSDGTTRIPLEGFSWNKIFEYFSKNLLRKFKFRENTARLRSTLHEDLCKFIQMPRWILNEKYFRQNSQRISKHRYQFCNFFFENHPVYEITWENMVNIIRHMRIVCWIT